MHSPSTPRLALLALTLGIAACSSAADPADASSSAPASSTADLSAPADAAYCSEPGRFTVTGAVVHDSATDAGCVEWQRAVPSAAFTQPEAVAYCESLDLDGRGWRLPTVIELASLVLHPIGLGASHEPTCEPSIDQVAFPSTPPDDFWTSVTRPGLDEAMYTGFDDGRSHPAAIDTPMSVRCVRSEAAAR